MRIRCVCFVVLCSVFLFCGVAIGQTLPVVQITHNEYDDEFPKISSGQVVWVGEHSPMTSDRDVYLYKDGQMIELTHDGDLSFNDYSCQIREGRVVWQREAREICLYENGLKQTLIRSPYGVIENEPQVGDGGVAWVHWDWQAGAFQQIFFYDGNAVRQITSDPAYKNTPQVSGGQIVWTGRSTSLDSQEIYLYDGQQVRRLTQNAYPDLAPQISDGQIVWQGWDGQDYEIYLFDGNQVRALTDNAYYDGAAQIDQGQVVWIGYDGRDYEIFLYADGKTTQLTDNDTMDSGSQVRGGQVAWTGYPRNSAEIFFYDGEKNIQVTDNALTDYRPSIDSGQIAWQGHDGHDYEIFLAPSQAIEVLDGAEFSAGDEVSDDPEKLVSLEGTPMKGAVADGVTRLLLRADVSGPCRMSVAVDGVSGEKEDGILRSIDGLQEGSSITVDSAATSRGEKVFCVYQAPEDFVRLSHAEEDKRASERALSLKVRMESFDGALLQESTIDLRVVRPPVVLVHGLWDGPETWVDIAGSMTASVPGLKIIRVDYEKTNARSLKANEEWINKYIVDGDEKIVSVRRLLRDDGIAMAQADVIGHSMGGLLARIYAGSDDEEFYYRKNNFYRGDIHKLFTLDSPHRGSFLADVATDQILKGPDSWQRGIAFFLFQTVLKRPIDQGAVEDLTTASRALAQMNAAKTDVLAHSLAGSYDVSGGDLDVIETADLRRLHKVLNFLGYDTRPYIVDDESDLVVSLASQAGRDDIAGVDVFSGLDHLSVLTFVKGAMVSDKVVELLNASADGSEFKRGF
jgi:pimeloyl-ACP methyl ester carboxylesterase